MNVVSDDPYWFIDMLKSLAASPDIPRRVITGLRASDPTIVDEAALALDKALTRLNTAGSSAVRTKRVTPLTTIASGAVIALALCEECELAPPASLVALFRRLLKVDRRTLGTSRALEAQTRAIVIVALVPGISPAALAREVGVHRSTTMRWPRDTKFMGWVRGMRTREQAEGFIPAAEIRALRSRVARRRSPSV